MEYLKDDSKYTLIFTILREIGLRISALCTLRTKHFLNHKGKYLNNCRKLEKGKKYRTFPLSWSTYIQFGNVRGWSYLYTHRYPV